MSNIFGSHDENTLVQFQDVSSRAVKSALMSDGHLGYVQPIGGVTAYDNKVSVVGIGFDIACGNAAIKTDITLENLAGISLEEIKSNPFRAISNKVLNVVADELNDTISFGIGRKNNAIDAPVDHQLFNSPAWSVIPVEVRHDLRDKAREQLGTVGGGNHYVDVFADKSGFIWIGVHFGSRGFGHTIASSFLSLSQGGWWGMRAKETEILLDLDTDMGRDYWGLMELAGEYAYVGREWVARKVLSILGGNELELVHNHHNFAWKERHLVNDEMRDLIVVRKGATPAFPGQRGFVGGSMGDNSVILQGSTATDALPIQENAMFSTVHGAGRVMSRTEAAGKRKGWGKKARIVKPGKITRSMMNSWVEGHGVVVRGGDVDESPHVYRRLENVLETQKPTIDVLETLRPLVVVMAGADVIDPFKD